MKTTVIHHSADFDGLFCREIARKFLPDAELIGWDFGQPLIQFPKEGNVYILDLSADCVAAGSVPEDWHKRAVWIDHHKSSIEKWTTTIPGYRIDGVAACRLAWQWFNLPLQERDEVIPMPSRQEFIDRTVVEPLAVRLAGEYDIWDKRDERTDIFQFGLRSVDLAEWWQTLLQLPSPENQNGANTICELLRNGALLQSYQQRNDAGMMKRGFLVKFEGLTFLALTTARCNSLTFASKDIPETGHDALMGFYFTGDEWGVSLYHANHRKDLDLSAIAVKYGGGGHRGACGFRAKSLPFWTAPI